MTLVCHGTQDQPSPAFDLGPDDRPIIVPILRSGILAQEFCRSGGSANVEAVFERSFYLRSGPQFICVGEPSIGNGPLTLVGPVGFLSGLDLRPNRSACVSDRHIAIGNAVRFSLDQCEPWFPRPWPVCQQPDRLIDISALSRRAAIGAPEEGFARAVFGAQKMSLPALARSARAHIAGFEDALSGVLAPRHAPAEGLAQSVRGLIGLGVGLTPSGDDFLVGALTLLDAFGERQAHAALARAITDVSKLTSPLSACFLRAAAAGHIGEHLQCAVASVIAGDVDAAIAAVETIGHSSGWDMLAGIATTLRIVAAGRLDLERHDVAATRLARTEDRGRDQLS